MSASTVAASALVVVLTWVGLTVWERTARTRFDRMAPEIKAAFLAHAAPYAERGEPPPPAYWDFRRGQAVEYPPGVAESVRGESTGDEDPEAGVVVATVVPAATAGGERWPVWTWGLWVRGVPPALFHGLFGAASAGLLALWLRLRTGTG